MMNAGICDGDLLVVDRKLPVVNDSIVICFIDGEYTIKRIKLEKDCCWLVPENENYEPIKVDQHNDFLVWGVVAYTVKAMGKYTPW